MDTGKIYILDKKYNFFPYADLANEDGLLAVGGDLSIERLLTAYANGIFPWYSEGEPIMWWSPDPRMILIPNRFKVSKSLKQTIRNKGFEVKFDHNFKSVILNCAHIPRKGQDGTWITDEMIEAYISLHKEGFAHSVEVYDYGKLVGGLYGVSIGKAFFGESMFHQIRDASKVALYFLVERMKEWNFRFIDVQQETSHLKSLGAEPVSRDLFLEMIREAIIWPTKRGKW